MESIRKPMEELVRRVVRMFYDPCHIVIMDIMLHHLSLDEEDLADKMKLLPREFNRMAVRLRDDKLLSSETTSDMKEDGRQETKTKFFLDFRQIRDVIKYKIYTITQRLEKTLREKESAQGMACIPCNLSYSVLDAQSFLSTEDFTFRCPECGESLTEAKETFADDKNAISNTFTKMMDAVSPLISQLKEIDAIGIPETARGKTMFTQAVEEPKILYEIPAEIEPEPKYPAQKVTEEIEIGEDTKEAEEEKSSRGVSPMLEEEEMLEVDGEKKKFSEITEEDKEKMNEKEYERYFELFEKYNG